MVRVERVEERLSGRDSLKLDSAAVGENQRSPGEFVPVPDQVPLAGMGRADAELFGHAVVGQVCAPKNQRRRTPNHEIFVLAYVQACGKTDVAVVQW
jgi:hypothetical protein